MHINIVPVRAVDDDEWGKHLISSNNTIWHIAKSCDRFARGASLAKKRSRCRQPRIANSDPHPPAVQCCKLLPAALRYSIDIVGKVRLPRCLGKAKIKIRNRVSVAWVSCYDTCMSNRLSNKLLLYQGSTEKKLEMGRLSLVSPNTRPPNVCLLISLVTVSVGVPCCCIVL